MSESENSACKLEQINDAIPNASELLLTKLAELQQKTEIIKVEIKEEQEDCPSKVVHRTMTLNGIRERAINQILNGSLDYESIKEECTESCQKQRRIDTLNSALAQVESQIELINKILG